MTTTFENAPTKTLKVGQHGIKYRDFGAGAGVPVVFLHHLTAVLDDWDPVLVDGIASERRVILFDNTGVGGSEGKTPDTVEAMAKDAVAFIEALGLSQVDLFGYSLGGFVAQTVATTHPKLVRRLILAGTSLPGGEGIASMGAVTMAAVGKGQSTGKHPKTYLFFSDTPASQAAAAAFLERLDQRKEGRDTPATNETIGAQIAAITKWGLAPKPTAKIDHPTLVVNGDVDVMSHTPNSFALFQATTKGELSIFPGSGHGAIFEHVHEFVKQARAFLDAR